VNQHRPWRAVVFVLAAGVLATACGPDEVPDARDEARAAIEVRPDATGVVTVALGGEPDEAAVARALDTIDGEVFPGRPATGAIIDNGDLPVLRFTSTDVFEQGDAPEVEVDTRGLCDDLAANGVRALDIELGFPHVPVERAFVPAPQSSDDSWEVQSCTDSPHGSAVMMPDPGRFWRELVLVLAVLLANTALLVMGKRNLTAPRWVTIVVSAIGVGASLVFIVTHGATAADHMEVAGRMTHGAGQVYFGASLVVVLFGWPVAIAQPFYWRLPKEQRPRLRRRPSRRGNDTPPTS
jgi:hypothetical protein